MENVGTIIREQRKKLGIKIIELAKMIGVHPVYITQIEKHNKLPSIVVYMNIEKFLKLPSTLRAQYYREKNPEVVKHWPTFELDEVFNVGPPDSLHTIPTIRILRYVNTSAHLKDVRSFIIGLFHDLDPNYKLSENEIKEYSKTLRIMAKHKAVYREEFKRLLDKLSAVNNILVPILGEGGPEYLKWGFF